MKNKQSLTLVIPVFNESDHLKRCLTSVKNQTIMPDHVFIVDNNSTDETVKIAQEFSFVTILHEQQQGIVFARNTGFNAVQSDIIGRIDADTVLPKNWVASMLEFYADPQHTTHAVSGGGYFYNFRLPRLNGWLQGQLVSRLNRLTIGHYILWGSNMALPMKVWQLVREQVCLHDDIHEDIDLAIHCHRAGFEISYREHIQVGVKLKRVWEDRWQQRQHLARWPRTFRVHGYKFWWLGSIGNVFLPLIGEPFFIITEGVARLCKRPRLPS